MIKGLYILSADSFSKIYGTEEQAAIAEFVDIYAPPQTSKTIAEAKHLLADAEVIFSGWGAPKMDAAFLNLAPRLRAVFYGAGSVKGFVTDAFWDRNIRVTSAYAANAVPVSEYTLATVLLSLKQGWHYILSAKTNRKMPRRIKTPGAYHRTVGIVSLGMVGRLVAERLRTFDLRLIAYDPYMDKTAADGLGVTLVLLEEVFRQADVVSLHTPWLKQTEGMITGQHFASMKHGATFINTARGAVVRENELIEVASRRPDLHFVLDVTHPEPPVEGSPLYSLPNVILTPHIAGSMDEECRRMGRYMVEELRRYVNGEDFRWGITREKAAVMA
jgi:phosphoglycerate dehydrogenase-like enzyme